jgi:hypothetical protein
MVITMICAAILLFCALHVVRRPRRMDYRLYDAMGEERQRRIRDQQADSLQAEARARLYRETGKVVDDLRLEDR